MKPSELQHEREHLAKADRDIAEGSARVTEQIARIRALAADGHDTVLAEELLAALQGQLEAWRVHCGLIAGRIAAIEADLPGRPAGAA